MKQRYLKIIPLIVGLLASLIRVAPGNAQSPASTTAQESGVTRDIESIFLSLPQQYILPSPASPATFQGSDRREMIDECDRKNGYLKFSGKGGAVWEGYGECALFRRSGKTPLIAVSLMSCGPACEQLLVFLTLERDVWHDVTREVFEPLSKERIRALFRDNGGEGEFTEDPPILYQIPRFGTSIDVIVQESIVGKQITLGRYRFENGRFRF